MNTIAVCRSPYHLELLRQNSASADLMALMCIHVVCNDIDNFYIGEESKSIAVSSIKKNRQYYKMVKEIIENYRASRIILFNTYTPLSKYLLKEFDGKGVDIELWEDGLNHYLHEHNGVKFYLKSAIKTAIGFYPGEAYSVYSRFPCAVRDRFDHGNLLYDLADVYNPDAEVYFIGQPIVEDGFVTREKFADGLKRVFLFANVRNVNYLPHPRERYSRELISSSTEIGSWNLVDPKQLGFASAEDLLRARKCSICFSAFSTVIFNLKMPGGRNFATPAFFGLHSISRKLLTLKSSGVSVVDHA
jgi:hypothetical protein